MKFLRCNLIVVLIAALVGAECASIPLKQKAVNGLQVSETALVGAQVMERQMCDPGKAAIKPPVAITTCLPNSVGLTTEKHKLIVEGLSKAFDVQIKTSTAIQAWKSGDPAPVGLADISKTVTEVLTVVRGLTGSPNVNSLAGKINLVLDQTNQLIDSFTKGK